MVLLIGGAEALVRGASRLATAAGIAPLVVGLTIVAFGTSAPEMAVSVRSALAFRAGADIALANVVGSNIFNILLILGLSALITPLFISQQLVRRDVPIMIGLSFLLLLLAADGTVGRLDGLVLFTGIVIYTLFVIIQGRKEAKEIEIEYIREFGAKAKGSGQIVVNVILVSIGIVMLVLGSRWLLQGAVEMANSFGVSDLIIGLTIVAAGTSLPEVATSVVASFKGERDIAVGNVVGSNIFNILAVLGLSAIVGPKGVTVASAALRFDIPVMIAVSVACLPVFFTGCQISRWEGLLFLGYYVAYTVYLVFRATQHDVLPIFDNVMFMFVLPITVLTFIVSVIRQIRRNVRRL